MNGTRYRIGGDEPGLSDDMEALYARARRGELPPAMLDGLAPRWVLAGRIVGTLLFALLSLVVLVAVAVGLVLLARLL